VGWVCAPLEVHPRWEHLSRSPRKTGVQIGCTPRRF